VKINYIDYALAAGVAQLAEQSARDSEFKGLNPVLAATWRKLWKKNTYKLECMSKTNLSSLV
jgi:hypothetical protein